MKKRNIGDEIIQGMHEAIDHMRGKKKIKAVIHKVKIPDEIDVRAIRKKLNLTRTEFAAKFGFSPRTLQHWEQGNRQPHGPAKVLLFLLQREPTVIEQILTRTETQSSRVAAAYKRKAAARSHSAS
jgi:putative transcriptional regulator